MAAPREWLFLSARMAILFDFRAPEWRLQGDKRQNGCSGVFSARMAAPK